MTEPPEDTHERLNRELARMQIRSPGLWGGWALLIATVGLFAFLSLNVPVDGEFITGEAGQTQPLLTETGAVQVMRVMVDGAPRDIRVPADLVHPLPGEPVCLRRSTRALTRTTSYTIAPRTQCDAPSATGE